MRENITRRILVCPGCNEKFQDLDGSGYCESCDPPDAIPPAPVRFIPTELDVSTDA